MYYLLRCTYKLQFRVEGKTSERAFDLSLLHVFVSNISLLALPRPRGQDSEEVRIYGASGSSFVAPGHAYSNAVCSSHPSLCQPHAPASPAPPNEPIITGKAPLSCLHSLYPQTPLSQTVMDGASYYGVAGHKNNNLTLFGVIASIYKA